MTDSTNLSEGQAAQPHPDLTSLDRLVGTWAVSGEAGEQLSTSGPNAASSCCSMSTSAAPRPGGHRSRAQVR